MSRVAALVCVVLAGCSAPAAEPVQAVDEPTDDLAAQIEAIWRNQTTMPLAAGEVPWHRVGQDTLAPYNLVSQAVAHPCTYNDGQEIYFNNRQLATFSVPMGTDRLHVTLDWDDDDYLRDQLRIGYRPGNETRYQESSPQLRGEPFEIQVDPDDWSAEGTRYGRPWDLWACLDTDTLDGFVPPGMFLGEVRFEVEALR